MTTMQLQWIFKRKITQGLWNFKRAVYSALFEFINTFNLAQSTLNASWFRADNSEKIWILNLISQVIITPFISVNYFKVFASRHSFVKISLISNHSRIQFILICYSFTIHANQFIYLSLFVSIIAFLFRAVQDSKRDNNQGRVEKGESRVTLQFNGRFAFIKLKKNRFLTV